MSVRFVAYGGVCFPSEAHATTHRSAEMDRPTPTPICKNCGEPFQPEEWSRWSSRPSTGMVMYITTEFEFKKENEE